MKTCLTLFFCLLALEGLYAQQNVKIEVTKKSPVACTRVAKVGDKVSVQYVLSLENGEEIDTSLDKGKPLDLTLGRGSVIKGFEQGILGMCFAEERRVTIPPHLGYGDREMGPIPPNSVLIFDIQLVKIE